MAISIRESVEYRKALIKETPNISFDSARSLLLSSKEGSANILNSCEEGSHKFTWYCPKCCSPWIAGFITSRLLPIPRNSSAIKRLERKEKARRLSSKEKALLCAYRDGSNAIAIKCTLCKYQVIEKCKLPASKRELKEGVAVTVPELENKKKKKKKKKRKEKELNAGLKLDECQSSLIHGGTLSLCQNGSMEEGRSLNQSDNYSHKVNDNFQIQNMNETSKIKDVESQNFNKNLGSNKKGVMDKQVIEDVSKEKKPLNNKRLIESNGGLVMTTKTQKNLTPKERKAKDKKLFKLRSVLSHQPDNDGRPKDLASFLGSLL